MATTASNLLGLTSEELISTSIHLIDNASNNALNNCFENVFKESIIKYLLKIVIPEEIHQLSATTKSDWKRVNLIQKISTLHEAPKAVKKSEPNTLDPKSSTHYLLTCGFIRNKLIGNENTQYLQHDIISICHRFVGTAPYNPLRIFNHESETYHSVSTYSAPVNEQVISYIKPANKQALPQFLSQVSSKAAQIKLIKPNKMLLFDSQSDSVSYCDSLPPFPQSSDICVNIQTMRSTTRPHVPQQGYYGYAPSPPDTCNRGASQYFDAERFQLLQLGGIRTRSSISEPTLSQPQPYPYGSPQRLTVTPVMHDTIYRYQMNHGANVLTKVINWIEAGHLIHARGYMSLCNVNEDRLVIIGGQQYEKYSDFTPLQLQVLPSDSVEIYDLTGNNEVNTSIKSMNCARVQCGSLYNDKSNQLIVFGGSRGFQIQNQPNWMQPMDLKADNLSRSMEIYDFHKNKWFEVPYKSKNKYQEYPCMWTIGSQCVFVSQIVQTYAPLQPLHIESEWIDLRVCDKSGTNRATFNAMDTVAIHSTSLHNRVPYGMPDPARLGHGDLTQPYIMPTHLQQQHNSQYSSWPLSMFVHYQS